MRHFSVQSKLRASPLPAAGLSACQAVPAMTPRLSPRSCLPACCSYPRTAASVITGVKTPATPTSSQVRRSLSKPAGACWRNERSQRLRLDNRYDLQDRWKPSIHLDQEPAVVDGRLRSTPHPALQDDQLMSEHRILRLKPDLRLERRGQHGQNDTDERDHRANLADSSLNKPG